MSGKSSDNLADVAETCVRMIAGLEKAEGDHSISLRKWNQRYQIVCLYRDVVDAMRAEWEANRKSKARRSCKK